MNQLGNHIQVQARMPSSIKIALLIMMVSALCSMFAAGALIFDGSYYLLRLVEDHLPFIPHARAGASVFQCPALLAIFLTDQLAPAKFLFCLSYSSIPLAALILSWLSVRAHRPSLFVWPVLAIALTGLPAQLIRIGEGLAVCELFWPLYLGLLTPVTPLKGLLLLTLATFLLSLHPAAMILLCVAAVTAVGLGIFGGRRDARHLFFLGAGMALLAGFRLILWFAAPDPYECAQLSQSELWRLFSPDGSHVLPAGLLSLCTGALFICAQRLPGSRYFTVAAWLSAIASWASAVWWMTHVDWWCQSFAYLRWLFAFICPMLMFALIDSLMPARQGNACSMNFDKARSMLTVSACVLFLSASIIQGALWLRLTNSLAQIVSSSKTRLINMDGDNWPSAAALAHWSVPSLAIILQGRNPSTIVLTRYAYDDAMATGMVRIARWEGPLKGKWFKLPERDRR